MKKKVTSIFTAIAIIIIAFTSCKQTYDSNNIPSGSTDKKESQEIYNGTTDARNEAVGVTNTPDSASRNNQQMEPANSTGASSITGRPGQ